MTGHPSPLSFNLRRLLTHSLGFYWKINLTVLLAAAVGVAVLTGSLLVGASMRGSLRQRALGRLGRIDQVLLSETFFREALAQAFPRSAPAVMLPCSVTHATRGTRAGKAQALGINDTFASLKQNSHASVNASQPSPTLAEDEAELNAALARRLGAQPGDEVIVRVQKPSAIPRETFIGERDDTLATLRLRVARIALAETVADLTLGGSQLEPLNIFVPLSTIQRRLSQPGRANTLFLTAAAINPQAILKQDATLEDAGLSLKPNPALGYTGVESAQVFIPPYLASLTTASAAVLKAQVRPTLTYLANTIRAGQNSTPYSMISALDDLNLKPGEIALNEWLAQDLGAKPGDKVDIGYYLPAAGKLTEATTTLTIARIVPLAGPWADRALTPDFPGLKEANRLSQWHPPFPLDMKRIRRKDEDYWNKYKATPKAFVALATGRALWHNPYGDFTSLRVSGAPEPALRAAMTKRLDPAAAGLMLRPIRAQALSASAGASDFGGLFIGFSLFLLVSAAMLIRILFQLGVQARAKEYGLLRATGYTPKRIRRLMLAEGALVAAGGAVLGLILGVAYAAVMLHGLRTWWVGAIGTPFLKLHVDAASLIGGALGGWLVALLAVWAAARRLSREPARALLAGRSVEEGLGRSPARVPLTIAILCALAGLGLAAAGPSQPAQDQAPLFFCAGALLLIAALAFFRVWLRRPPRHSAATSLTVTRLGILAARRRPGRSMLVASLMASAAFIIVAVGANRQVAQPTTEKSSGSGGFALLAETTLPLYKPLDPAALHGAIAYPLRLRPGDDASCLNLYKAARPRIIGASEEFIQRGGFVFASSLSKKNDPAQSNPWLLLERPLPDGATPVIGDYNSVLWLLHSGLGKDLIVDGHRFRFVGLLKGSVFQSELIISESAFKKLFPTEAGWRLFAIETPVTSATPGATPSPTQENTQTLVAALESQYADHGLEAISTAERLNELLAVENTYLATFQALGGLGLLLGTLGLALALVRNLIERRAELALLRAVGWRASSLLWLAAAENLLLLLAGLAAGVVCALVAVLPAVASRAAQAPWASLAVTVLGILVFGVAATLASAAGALRSPIVQTLKAE